MITFKKCTQQFLIVALSGLNLCFSDDINSTGFNGEGAQLETVKLMRSILPNSIKIKASGGIRDKKTAIEMINAGADRIGTSSGFTILEE